MKGRKTWYPRRKHKHAVRRFKPPALELPSTEGRVPAQTRNAPIPKRRTSPRPSTAAAAAARSAASPETHGDILQYVGRKLRIAWHKDHPVPAANDTVAERLPPAQAVLLSPLEPINQVPEDRCVASALCLGMYLRALTQADRPDLCELLRDRSWAPSVNHLYHRQRFLECAATKRCRCGEACNGLCDPRCGSVLSYILDVCTTGVALESAWPLADSRRAELAEAANAADFLARRPYYTLSRYQFVEMDAGAGKRVVEALRRGIPCVLNLFVYENHETFMRTQARTRQSEDGVYAARHRMPAGAGTKFAMGHCVLAVGTDGRGHIRVRNSFGARWGYYGDFNITVDFITQRHVHNVVALEEVTLHDLDSLAVATVG